MTSSGLAELKRLINEAALRRVTLIGAISDSERQLQSTEHQLRKAQRFLIRLFSQQRITHLAEEIQQATADLARKRSSLEGCEIDVDFAFDERTMNAFAALIRAYDNLRQSASIWDITSSIKTNRSVQRTLATEALNRVPVRLDLAQSEVINSRYQALRLGNANGEDISIYPGFVMMRSAGEDFALIDVRELEVGISTTRFIEEEEVPADTEILDYTWAKTNKDGTPDRRFQDNYQIPIVRYAQVWFRSPTGLQEAYMFSSAAKAERFATAFAEYQTALASLAEHSTLPTSEAPPSAPADEAELIDGDETVDVSSAPTTGGQRGLFLDWITLSAIVLMLGVGTYELVRRGAQTQAPQVAASAQPSSTQSKTPPPLQPPTAVPPVASASSVPVVATTRAVAPPQREIVFVQKNGVNVRAEPSTSSAIVRTEGRAKRLTVFQRVGAWVQVGEAAPNGWIHSDLLGPSEPATLAPPMQLGTPTNAAR